MRDGDVALPLWRHAWEAAATSAEIYLGTSPGEKYQVDPGDRTLVGSVPSARLANRATARSFLPLSRRLILTIFFPHIWGQRIFTLLQKEGPKDNRMMIALLYLFVFLSWILMLLVFSPLLHLTRWRAMPSTAFTWNNNDTNKIF